MVVPRPAHQLILRTEKLHAVELPVIDLASDRSDVSTLVVAACEKFGFFKVVNHGVPDEVIAAVEEEGLRFFNKPSSDKEQVRGPSPFGYGSKTIGFNGDTGEVEYLLLSANDSVSVAKLSENISDDPPKFRGMMSAYIGAVGGLACSVLKLIGEGLELNKEAWVFSEMIKVDDSDSVLRLNYYPPTRRDCGVVGFGEHTDPQILTILRSNGVEGLQISLQDGVWITVPPDPTAFWVNVGDALHVMTNGRLKSVRHRAISNPWESRMSIAYFAGPSLNARISPPAQLVTPYKPRLYRSFTWADYKKAAYSLQLGDTRLHLFRSIYSTHTK